MRSMPAENIFSPDAEQTTALTSESSATDSKTFYHSTQKSAFIAFSFLGRSMSTWSTWGAGVDSFNAFTSNFAVAEALRLRRATARENILLDNRNRTQKWDESPC